MTDRRVQRTKTALRQAYRKIARQYPYHDITVKQLTDEANINRKTFYLHYDSIDDLAYSFADEIADKLLKLLFPTPGTTYSTVEPGFWYDRLSAFFEEAPDFYTFILTSDDYSFVSRRAKRQVAIGLTQNFQLGYGLSKADAKICANFLIDGTLTLFRLRITGQIEMSSAELKQKIVALNLTGLRGFLKS
ncbi:TetR/AcrR family transcriptional regulator [Levilactobacillus brevis]|uniref:HTH tetR-type domain-containing protein n=1 Tax=Levilactobacillus brevis ATCC 14869 = DSM 20054 TaxID=649758 RepID=U2PAP0_LEVBR|nr:TetR family transcriptional regulator [Levilactobacillus brevis]ERK41191.1 hypothetical protein HMPREF0495_02403 [Levilactobacillus brevis ATCC 14869 = DSM 20054]KIO98224.1 putative transcription regulator (putative) [Levilactobacillus brevis]KRK19802.1 transcriptional regulator [Levilactobacillus brevis ATCC 14869 = DSM 20054]MCT3572633.1 TetR/AcrR family transcriptional regulator [Levilactobacillus brevis]SQG75483.1 transcriptional regulator [Levilactobacillus brevis]